MGEDKWKAYRKRGRVRARRTSKNEWIADRGGGTHDEIVPAGNWIVETWSKGIGWTDEYQMTDPEFRKTFTRARGR